MATDHELNALYLLQYKICLNDLEIFERNFPNSKEEYNYWRGALEKMTNNMKNSGITDFEPLPAKK
jgi:hypothetical protein